MMKRLYLLALFVIISGMYHSHAMEPDKGPKPVERLDRRIKQFPPQEILISPDTTEQEKDQARKSVAVDLLIQLYCMIKDFSTKPEDDTECRKWIASTNQSVSALFNGAFSQAFNSSASISTPVNEGLPSTVTDQDITTLTQASNTGKAFSNFPEMY